MARGNPDSGLTRALLFHDHFALRILRLFPSLFMQRDPQKKQLKRSLRRSIIAAILALEPARRSVEEAQLLESLARLPGYERAESVLFYVKAFPEELDTRLPMIEALKAGKRVLCPRVERAEHRLRLFEIRSLTADLEPGILGIPEPRRGCTEVDPDDVDWALIPGLAFDLQMLSPGSWRRPLRPTASSHAHGLPTLGSRF